MNSVLLFDFLVNKENKTIQIKREFDADLELVWEAWTNPKILAQWFAPKPSHVETKSMDFRDGGFWHFAIVNPQNKKYWSRYEYQKIEPRKSMVELRAFSDENGTVTPDFQRTQCTTLFHPTDGITLVTVTARYGSVKVFEFMASQGHKKGIGSTFKNLDKILNNLKDKR